MVNEFRLGFYAETKNTLIYRVFHTKLQTRYYLNQAMMSLRRNSTPKHITRISTNMGVEKTIRNNSCEFSE